MVGQPNSPNTIQNFKLLATNIDLIINQAWKSFAIVNNDLQQAHTERNDMARNLQNNINKNTEAIRALGKPDLSAVYKSISDNVASLQRNINIETNQRNETARNLQNNINGNTNRIRSIEQSLFDRAKDVGNLQNNINKNTNRISSVEKSLSDRAKDVSNLQGNINRNTERVVSIEKLLNTETSERKSSDAALEKKLNDEINARKSENKSFADFKSLAGQQLDSIILINTKQELDIKGLNSKINDVKDSLSNYLTEADFNNLNTFNTEKFAQVDESINSLTSSFKNHEKDFQEVKKRSKRDLDAINERIDNIHFNDSNIVNAIKSLHDFIKLTLAANILATVHAVDVVRDRIVDFNTSFVAFVPLFKIHLDNIVTSINNNFKNYTKLISDNHKDLKKDLAKYFDIHDELSSWSLFGAVLDDRLELIQEAINVLVLFKDVVNDYLSAVNSNLSAIIEYLKNFKPNITNTIYLGNQNSDSGQPETNIWDVIKSWIENLDDILKVPLKLLELLFSFIRSLIVPDSLDGLNSLKTNFDSNINRKFSFVGQFKHNFVDIYNSPRTFDDITINGSGLFSGSFTIPLSLINIFAPYVKALANGFLVLAFLQSCYVWYHKKFKLESSD